MRKHYHTHSYHQALVNTKITCLDKRCMFVDCSDAAGTIVSYSKATNTAGTDTDKTIMHSELLVTSSSFVAVQA
jgi:hypothetical protein